MPAPTPYVPSIVIDTVISALGAFAQPFIGEGTPIVRGQQNRVASPPSDATGWLKLTELLQVDLETPVLSDDAPDGQIALASPKRIDVQMDFYSPSAGDWCAAVKGVYRSAYAVAQFPAGIAPLYCDDGRQMPLITAEQQYEDRWTLTATLQYNPVVSLPQQSADTLAVKTLKGLA